MRGAAAEVQGPSQLAAIAVLMVSMAVVAIVTAVWALLTWPWTRHKSDNHLVLAQGHQRKQPASRH